MTQLSADTARSFELGDLNDLPVKESSAIYQGSAVGITAGYARQLTAGDQFGGFAEEGVESQTSDGGAYVTVRARGRIKLTITSVAATDIGKPVFASDGNAFTLTQGSNTHIGRVARYVTTDTAIVIFDATRAGAGVITELTDSSGGTASDTLAAITGSYVEATVENTVASLAAKVNALIRQRN
jgi:hypothetical protein